MVGGTIALLIVLVFIAVSRNRDRRREPEPWQSLVGCGCLGAALLFWLFLILTIMQAG